MLNEMTINGVDISAYNARLQSYSVSGTTVTNNLSASRSILTAPLLFSSVPGTRTLTLTLTFYPHYLGDYAKGLTVSDRLAIATENITVFEGLLVGKVVEIALPDGFIYTAIVNSIAAATFDSSGEHDVTYTFNTVRHKAVITQSVKPNGYIICESNTPTLPVVTAKYNSIANTRNKVKLADVTIKSVTSGMTVVIDSVAGLITADGKNKFNDSDLIDFPVLNPGKNIVSSTESDVEISVSYTPIYI